MERVISKEQLKSLRLPAVVVWLAVFLLMAGLVSAQQQYKIVDIRVEGNQNASEKTIRNVANLRIGSYLSGTAIQDAVKNLYDKGIFRDIVVDVEQVAAGVVVVFKVSEYPQLTSIDYVGNKKIDDKEMKELVKLAEGGYISDHLIVQTQSKIRNAYMNKGYFLIEVKPELTYSEDSSKADLVIRIKEYGIGINQAGNHT